MSHAHIQINKNAYHDFNNKVYFNNRGQALIQALVLTVLLNGIAGVGVNYYSNEVKRSATQTKSAARNAVASIMNNAITSPGVLHRSLFDATCVDTALNSAAPNLNSHSSPCLDAGGGTFVAKELFSPVPDSSGNPVRVSGTQADPVLYTSFGSLCTGDPSEICNLAVYSEVRNGVTYNENGVAKDAVTIRYYVESVAANDQEVGISVDKFRGEATIPIEKFNGRHNPAVFAPCRDSTGAITTATKGQISLGVARNTTWTNNEENVCVEALGARLCPQDRFLVGFNGNGEPICRGAKTACPAGTVQMGYANGAGGGAQPWCVPASCRDRAGRFGFLSPKAADDLTIGHECILISNPPACATKIKRTITSTGELGCT